MGWGLCCSRSVRLLAYTGELRSTELTGNKATTLWGIHFFQLCPNMQWFLDLLN